MLSIRLSRLGKKKQPLYRLIVCEKTKDPWGDNLEILGTYNPKTKVAEIKSERVNYWIGCGAQPSPTVRNLLITSGVIKGEKVRASKSKPGKKKAAEIESKKKLAAAAAKAEAETKEAEAAADQPTIEAVPAEPEKSQEAQSSPEALPAEKES